MASRKDARDAVVAARKAFAGWSGATAYNRGQVLYRVAEMLEGRRGAVRRRGRAPARASPRARPRPSSTRRSTAGSGTPAGPTRSPRCTASANPVAGPYFNFSVPEPTGVVAVLAPQDVVAARAGLAWSRRSIVTGNTVRGASPARPRRCRRSRWPRCWPPPTCRAAWSTCSPAAPPRSRPWLASHMDVNAIDLTGAPTPTRGRAGGGRGREPQAGAAAPAGAADWTADPGPRPACCAFLETKTVWHPIGV